MLSSYRHQPQRGSVCHRCQVIRVFIIATVCVAVFAIVADEQRQYLKMVTPMRAALVICLVGMVGFIIKLIGWKMAEARVISDDPAPAAPQVSASEKTGHKPSH